MHPSLLILLIGLLYLLGFGGLSYLRRQGLPTRFAIEGLIIIAVSVALTLANVPLHPLLFLIILYLVTMRVRLLVDLGNWLTARGNCRQALDLYQFTLRLGPDAISRQIVLINRGVTLLRMQDPEAARLALMEALINEQVQPGAKYLAAGYYNLGLACRRTGREAEAVRHFNEAVDTLPDSIYAHGARQALKHPPQQTTSNDEHAADRPNHPAP
ncbi:MAG TPA: tetratricopeptide repeat protein [Chloroflexi bacterium]|nr:tetratricopeptide repeat protein [Chloroflexota bacterium]